VKAGSQVGVEQVERDPVPVEAFEEGGDKWGKEECDTSGCLIIWLVLVSAYVKCQSLQ
jgi:hypothetical protein